MANYGTISRYKLRSLSDWLSNRGSKFAKAFRFDGMAWVGASGTLVTMELGPIVIGEMLHSLPRSYLRYNVERRLVSRIDSVIAKMMLSVCDGATDVGNLSDIISIECHRLSECWWGTIFSWPGILIDRPIFMSHWDLVITGQIPHGEAVRMDRDRCSLITDGWPRVDRLADHLMDGGTIRITICIEESSAVARYRFVEVPGGSEDRDAHQS